MDSSSSPCYCSFVGEQSIICECGYTFNNEEELKEHLSNNHDVAEKKHSIKKETASSQNTDMEDSDDTRGCADNEKVCVEIKTEDDNSLDISEEIIQTRPAYVKLKLPITKTNKPKKKSPQTTTLKDDIRRLVDNQSKYDYKVVLKKVNQTVKPATTPAPSPKKNIPLIKIAKNKFKLFHIENNQFKVKNVLPEQVEHSVDLDQAIVATDQSYQPSPDDEQTLTEVTCESTSPKEQTVEMEEITEYVIYDDETQTNAESEEQPPHYQIVYQVQEENDCEYEEKYQEHEEKYHKYEEKEEESIETEEVYQDSNMDYDNETEIATGVILKENIQAVCNLTFKCDQCDKVFTSAKTHISHYQRAHRDNKPRKKQKINEVICETCGKKCTSKIILQYHQNAHTGEKPYLCPYCSKGFSTPMLLQVHIRIHTGECPYQCPLCPKAFKNKAALNRHDRVHTGVKPYACPKCGKCFTQSNSMKLHVRTVHLKLPAPYKRKPRLVNHSKLDDDALY